MSREWSDLRIDQERLWSRLMELGAAHLGGLQASGRELIQIVDVPRDQANRLAVACQSAGLPGRQGWAGRFSCPS